MRFYKNKQNHKIAYKSLKGSRLGIIFIHGLNSDMNGGKALAIEQYAKKNKLNFIRFDVEGMEVQRVSLKILQFRIGEKIY